MEMRTVVRRGIRRKTVVRRGKTWMEMRTVVRRGRRRKTVVRRGRTWMERRDVDGKEDSGKERREVNEQ